MTRIGYALAALLLVCISLSLSLPRVLAVCGPTECTVFNMPSNTTQIYLTCDPSRCLQNATSCAIGCPIDDGAGGTVGYTQTNPDGGVFSCLFRPDGVNWDFSYSGTLGCRLNCAAPTPPANADPGTCTGVLGGNFQSCEFALKPGATLNAATSLKRTCSNGVITAEEVSGALYWKNDAESSAVGDPLILEAALSPSFVVGVFGVTNTPASSCSMGDPAAVTFQWTSSQAGLNAAAGGPLQYVTGPRLVLDESITSLWRAGDSRQFTLNARSNDSSCLAVLQRTLRITPRVSLEVTAPADPCTVPSTNPCIVGWGSCTSSRNASAPLGDPQAQWAVTCACPEAPVRFHGPLCTFALVGCPDCVAPLVSPTTASNASDPADQAPPTKLRVFGIGLGAALNFSVRGVDARVLRRELLAGANDTQVAQALSTLRSLSPSFDRLTALQVYTIAAPPIIVSNSTASSRRLMEGSSTAVKAGYQPLESSVLYPSSSQVATQVFPTLVYYASPTCLRPGEFRLDPSTGACECPSGGSCPGGGRVWPVAGWWALSEFDAPLPCVVREACTGVSTTAGVASSTGAGGYFRDGEKCAPGYEGVRCAACSTGFFQLNGRCVQCDSSSSSSSSSQSGLLALVLIVVLALVVLYAAAVASLSTDSLAARVAEFTLLQSLVSMGLPASQGLPRYAEEVSQLFTWANLVNFEVEVVRPGCGGVPAFSFVSKFQATLVFMLVAALVSLGACAVRMGVRTVRARRAAEAAAGADGGNGGQQAVQVKSTDADAAAEGEEAELEYNPTPAADFVSTSVHAVLILFSIMYLRLITLFLTAYSCGAAGDPSDALGVALESDYVPSTRAYLLADYQTLCWEGAHRTLVGGVAALILLVAFGFPLLCFALLTRAFANADSPWIVRQLVALVPFLRPPKPRPTRAELAERAAGGIVAKEEEDSEELRRLKLAARFGFLFDGYRDQFYFTALVELFAVQIFCAVIVVFAPSETDEDGLVLLFLFGILFWADCAFTAVMLPWEDAGENEKAVLLGMLSVTQSIILIGVQLDGWKSGYFISLCVLSGALFALLLVQRLRAASPASDSKVAPTTMVAVGPASPPQPSAALVDPEVASTSSTRHAAVTFHISVASPSVVAASPEAEADLAAVEPLPAQAKRPAANPSEEPHQASVELVAMQ